MGCNCKTSDKSTLVETNNNKTLKVILFIFSLVMLPIINLFLIYALFKHIVLSKSLDLVGIITAINNKIKPHTETVSEPINV
jgi:hypothetical protein